MAGGEPCNGLLPDEWSFSFNILAISCPMSDLMRLRHSAADRGHFHFGSRYNYEDKETGSLWVGYNFKRW